MLFTVEKWCMSLSHISCHLISLFILQPEDHRPMWYIHTITGEHHRPMWYIHTITGEHRY